MSASWTRSRGGCVSSPVKEEKVVAAFIAAVYAVEPIDRSLCRGPTETAQPIHGPSLAAGSRRRSPRSGEQPTPGTLHAGEFQRRRRRGLALVGGKLKQRDIGRGGCVLAGDGGEGWRSRRRRTSGGLRRWRRGEGVPIGVTAGVGGEEHESRDWCVSPQYLEETGSRSTPLPVLSSK